MMTVMAGASGLTGVVLLYSSWAKILSARLRLFMVGWLLIAVSSVLWIEAAGVEYGSVYFIAALPLGAWLVVGYRAKVRSTIDVVPARQSISLPSSRTVGRHVGLLLLVLPVAGFLSAVLSLFIASFFALVRN